jgi:hypothetical protein
MKLYEVWIHLTLSRTVEVPDDYVEYEEIDYYINEKFVRNSIMKEAIDDNDYEIRDWDWNRVGSYD